MSATGALDVHTPGPYAHGWYAFIIVLLILQITTSMGRYGIRWFLIKKLGWDDLGHFLTLCVTITYCSLLIPIFTNPNLNDVRHMASAVMMHDQRLVQTNLLLYILGVISLKLSVGAMLLRIFVLRWQVLAMYAVMAITTFAGTFAFFFTLFECGNPTHFFARFLAGQCLVSHSSIAGVQYMMSVVSVFGDFTYCVLPKMYLWSANMDRTTKVCIAMVSSLVCVACIVSIARIPEIHFQTTPSENYLYAQSWCSTFSAAELSIGVSCLALSSYRPLLKHIRRRLGSSIESGARKVNGDSGGSCESKESGSSESSYDHYDVEAVHSLRSTEDTQMIKRKAQEKTRTIEENTTLKREETWLKDSSDVEKIPRLSETATWFHEGSDSGHE